MNVWRDNFKQFYVHRKKISKWWSSKIIININKLKLKLKLIESKFYKKIIF